MSEAMTETTELAPFDSMTDAEDAYFGDGEGHTKLPEPSDWDEWEHIDVLPYEWTLTRQYAIEGDDTRYFVIFGPDEEDQALNQSGEPEPFLETDWFDDLPAHDTEEDAREAHAAWVEQYGDQYEDETGEDGPGWSEWDELYEEPPWFVYAREEIEGEAIEAVIAGVNSDGSAVYLAPNVEILDDPYIYADFGAVEDALAAYFAAVEAGDVPEGDQPTGAPPGVDVIDDATPDPPGSRPGGIVGSILGNPLMLVAVVVVAYLLYRRYQAGNGGPDPAGVGPGGGPEI